MVHNYTFSSLREYVSKVVLYTQLNLDIFQYYYFIIGQLNKNKIENVLSHPIMSNLVYLA